SALFLTSSGDHRDLHSFPTRRSSDLLALEDPTTAVVAHGLLNSMAALTGTATTLLHHWELFSEDPDKARDLLGRIVRQATMASGDRKSTRLNSSHDQISYAVFCLKKK